MVVLEATALSSLKVNFAVDSFCICLAVYDL